MSDVDSSESGDYCATEVANGTTECPNGDAMDDNRDNR